MKSSRTSWRELLKSIGKLKHSSTLEELGADNHDFGSKLQLLIEAVEHHVEEEEGEMFSKIRELFDEDEIEQLGQELESAKVHSIARPSRGDRGSPPRWILSELPGKEEMASAHKDRLNHAPDKSTRALLLIDVINDLEFEMRSVALEGQ